MRKQLEKDVKWNDVKQDILKVLENQSNTLGEPVSLLDGFVSSAFSTELSDAVMLGGKTIPMVVLIGENSRRLYFFALKALLKNMEW